jgi:hypothetical protein
MSTIGPHIFDKIEEQIDIAEQAYQQFYELWHQNLGGTHCVHDMIEAVRKIKEAIIAWEEKGMCKEEDD